MSLTGLSSSLPEDFNTWSKNRRCQYLALNGYDAASIAGVIATPPKQVRSMLSRMRAKGDAVPGAWSNKANIPAVHQIVLPPALAQAATAAAKARGMTTPDLITMLVVTALADDMVGAVLDLDG